ncbi:MAG: hypothetical protein HYW47_01970 [Deltaproteobacteria bacterium]|nr:hypothetical protein [Deltaproteobacteria bacterium]
MILSLHDIFFQFTVLFGVGIFLLLIPLPVKFIGEKFFESQTWFAVGCLSLGLLGRFYQFISQHRELPFYLFLYVLVVGLSFLYVRFLRETQFQSAKVVLFLQAVLIIVGLYFHAGDLSRNRFYFENIGIFTQFLMSSFLLGSVFTSMMLCHWFFMNHKLPIKYLKRMSQIFTFSLIAKIFFTGVVLWVWKIYFSDDFSRLVAFEGGFIYLMMRFILGLLFPLILAFGTEVTIKLPTNHAAIGILYVAVIFIFMGEVLGQYLSLIQRIPL